MRSQWPTRAIAAAGIILAAIAGCQGPPSPSRHAATFGLGAPDLSAGRDDARPRGPGRLFGSGVRDWSFDRVAGAALNRERQRLQLPSERTLLAFGDTTGWTGGIALTDPPFAPVTGVATNAPAWAYRSNVVKLVGRLWFLTTTGWLLGVDRSDPRNTAANPNKAPIKIALGHPCTNAFVTLSDDGRRAYVVSDDGHLLMADLAAGSLAFDLAIDPSQPAAPSLGMAAYLDPVLTDVTATLGQDVIFTALNNGRVARFDWDGATLTRGAIRMGVTIDRAADGSSTNLLMSTPVAHDGKLYYGDRAGNLILCDFAAPAGPTNPRTLFLDSSWPIEAPVTLAYGADMRPAQAFVPVGAQVAWVDLTGAIPTVTLSPPLLIDAPTGGPPPLLAGSLASFASLYQGIHVNGLAPVEAATALVPDAPPGTGLALVNGDTPDPNGTLASYRTASVGAAQRIDGALPLGEAVYGTPNEPGETRNGAIVKQIEPAVSRSYFNAPLDLAIGPAGEVFLSGKEGPLATALAMVPARPMDPPRWGYTAETLTALTGHPTFQPGRTYFIAGTGSPASANSPLGEAHALAYDDNQTPATDQDDSIWVAEWRSHLIRQIMLATGTILPIAGGTAPYPAGHLSHPHGICRARGAQGAPVFFTQADRGDLVRYDPTSGATTIEKQFPGLTFAGIAYGQGPADGPQGAIYLAARDTHVVYKYDIATGSSRLFAGMPGEVADTPSADGILASNAHLAYPEVVAVHPNTGDVYIGESGGRRLKVVYGQGERGGRMATLAGNGRAHYPGDGLAGPGLGLGWISGLRLGPPALDNAANDPFGALYLTSRELHCVVQLRAPSATPAGTRGLLRWDLAALAGKAWLSARLDLTVFHGIPAADEEGRATTVPPPEIHLANATLAGTSTPWTAAALLPHNLPTTSAVQATFADDATAAARPWVAGATAAFRLPAGSLPTDGTLALAVLPPATPGLTTHDPWGPGFAYGVNERTGVDFHGLSPASAPDQRPRLTAFLSQYRLKRPILAPPVLYDDGTHQFAYVMNANALFRLDYGSPAAFANTATFCASRLGRTNDGPLDATVPIASRPFMANPTSPGVTFSGRIYALDRQNNGATWNFTLNKFDGVAAIPTFATPPTSCQLDGVAIADPTFTTGTYFVSDNSQNDFGFAYFGLGNGRIYRLGL